MRLTCALKAQEGKLVFIFNILFAKFFKFTIHILDVIKYIEKR